LLLAHFPVSIFQFPFSLARASHSRQAFGAVRYSIEHILSRARETARQVVALLRDGRRVARFVEDYAEMHGRAALKADAAEYRELIAQITREALLAVCAQISAALPRWITESPTRRLTSHDVMLADGFCAEFFLHLAKEMRWSSEELEVFWRELDQYTAIASCASQKNVSGGKAQQRSGPFADRCALLLDPSLFVQACCAAEKFQQELDAFTKQLLKATFAGERKNRGDLFGRERKKR
jgi:hypothetical protein